MQIDEREEQRQTASKGAMRIFTPLFEVAIEVQGVLNWEQNENNKNNNNKIDTTSPISKCVKKNDDILLMYKSIPSSLKYLVQVFQTL